ncbi:MAG: nucleotide sugar dehydrogenase, partial [Alphaproteobacteria bacterium]|nr:nucleotide sugar dehydrogenase [Alphaproteobacteria bacterium]
GRIDELRAGIDTTFETTAAELGAAENLEFTSNSAALERCAVFIITVPTPIDGAKRPDLEPIRAASRTVGTAMREGAVVIYESTVYPGCTREVCVPILEEVSGLKFNRDFFVGYSPERINPGDKEHRLTSIIKVTSGSTPEVAKAVDDLYASIITAGTHSASSIEVAEAAKVIENTQRDLNIALMNELALIFSQLGIDTHEVLAAAGTKWNFLKFTPGLVGGHCIGVDPYYLTHKAQEIGYHPEVILAGRRINDRMGKYAAEQFAKLMMGRGFPVVGSKILVLGASFKENCPDIRNSKVLDVINTLRGFRAEITVWDPWVDPARCQAEFGVASVREMPAPGRHDGLVAAVGHEEFHELGPAGVRALGCPGAVLYDVKGIFSRDDSDGRL